MTTHAHVDCDILGDPDELHHRLANLQAEVLRIRAHLGMVDGQSSLESTIDGLVVYDSAFHFVNLNADAERLLRISKGDVIGKTQWSVFPDTAGTELEHQYRRAMVERTTVTFDNFYTSLDTWLELRISPKQGGGILVWLHDIPAGRQAEIQRKQLLVDILLERQLLNEIVQNAPVAISVLRAPEFVYELINPTFQSLAPDKQFVGAGFSAVWGEASESMLPELTAIVESGQPFEATDRAWTIQRSADAPVETIYISSSWIPLIGPAGIPDRILTLAIETTGRKQHEDQLRTSEARLARAQRMASLGSWEQDVETGEIQLCEYACRLFGITPTDEPISLDGFVALVHPEDQASVRGSVYRTSAYGVCSQVDYRVALRDGAQRFVRQLSERFCEDDSRSRVLGTVQDITEQKQLEERFRRAQRLEGIARLAGGVAHDFNNLLVVINGYAQTLADDLSADDPRLDHAQEILNAGNRAAALTRQLLTFSRKQAMQPVVVNIDTLLGDFEKLLRRLIREDIMVKRTITQGLWNVYVDPAHIEQVIMNLAVNARDAMPGGGTLTLGTSNFELGEQEARTFIDLTSGRYVSVTVTDSGTGMTDEIKQRLFEPFFTTKPPGEGSGLGLSMVYGIVKQHGGDVSVYSELGIGTTFRIFLPVTDQTVDEARRDRPQRIVQRGSETILLVEDDEKVRKLVRGMLLSLGYEVIEARRCLDGLSIVRQHTGGIDLLLSRQKNSWVSSGSGSLPSA